MLNESIFREYDIRGIVEEDLKDEDVEKIAMAFATVYMRAGAKKISVGMDGRPSSDRIRSIFIENILKFGIDVIDIGLAPTPVLYYAVFKMELDGGVIITASHNPPEYNGFKALLGKYAMSGEQIREIYQIAKSGKFQIVANQGGDTTHDKVSDYIKDVSGQIK